MPSIKSIRFDNTGWQLLQETDKKIVWGNTASEPGDVISLHFFPVPPDIPAPLSDVASIRNSYRAGANQAGAGMIAVDVISVKNVPAIKTLLKFPQEPSGMTYVGAVTIPYADFSYVIKVQSFEIGMTGAREAVIMAHMLQTGEAEIEPEKNRIKGWSKDPYAPERDFPNPPNLAEDEKFDGEFPNHPLTRVRRILNQVLQTLTMDPDVTGSRIFD